MQTTVHCAATHSDLVDDLANLGFEPHVQHAVSLVQNQVRRAPQIRLAHLQVVQQTTGRRDHHLSACKNKRSRYV